MSKVMAAISRMFLRKPAGKRMYAAARPGRMSGGYGMTSSADTETVQGLTRLRNESRRLIRDNPHAKRAQFLVTNNIVGSGIGMQAAIKTSHGNMADRINDAIEAAWSEWCCAENCHIAGVLNFADIERLLIDETFEAGDVLVRMHRRAVGESTIPLCLEVIEAERLADEWEAAGPMAGNTVRQGVEVDEFHKPIAYWIHRYHPGDPRRDRTADSLIRVPASEMFHLRDVKRWPQTRGVPWMHAGMTRLHQLGEFGEAALVAARIGAEKVMVLKETEDGRVATVLAEEGDGKGNDGTLTWNSSKGQVDILPSGTDIANWSPNYPDQLVEPFVRSCLRDIAAAFGVSYESLSRDYSQSNYSSSRLALIDDRDGWRALQKWYIRSFRERLYETWLDAAVLSGSIPEIPVADYLRRPEYYECVKWKPRGWSWVDPTKEVAAYKEAVRCGFTSVSRVIAMTGDGADLEDILDERAEELAAAEEKQLKFDTDPAVAAGDPKPAAEPSATDPEPAAKPAAVVQISGSKR